MSTMPQRVLARLTYANIVSTLALVVALGTGTAYAANTIFTIDIVDGEVKHADLDGSAVQGDRIADGSVGRADLAPDALVVAGDRVVDGSLALVDLTGVDVRTTLSVPKTRPGQCATRSLTVVGARLGEVAVVSPQSALRKGLLLTPPRVAGNDRVQVDVCNIGPRKAKAHALPVRVVTFS
jgi:hypothetical protein